MTEKHFHPDMVLPVNNEVFVFGSNEAGIHGKGAALIAREKYGAKLGIGFGYMEDNLTPYHQHCFAIPTKDAKLKALPLNVINKNVQFFLDFAKNNPHLTFYVTRVGCGLAGYEDRDIAPMFAKSTGNLIFPIQWHKYVEI